MIVPGVLLRIAAVASSPDDAQPATSPAASSTGSPELGGVVADGGAVGGAGVDGDSPPVPSLCSTSRYAPKPDGVANSSALSTPVPSPHSLKVVTSWKGAFDATRSRTFWFHRARSRARRAAG